MTWLDEQLALLHGALDDVVDLERGLADAMLAREHTELVGGLDEMLNLNAGLLQVVPPRPAKERPRAAQRLAKLADQLSELPAAERLATRAWLPVRLLVEARSIAVCTVHAHLAADALSGARPFDDARTFDVIRFALTETLRVVDDLDDRQARSFADVLVDVLSVRTSPESAHNSVRHHTRALGKHLTTLLFEISRASRKDPYFRYIFLHAARVQEVGGRQEFADLAEMLPGVIDKLLSAVTSMVGADLASADLEGLPLDGVRWSPDTRWPPNWQAWVRANSVAISPDVFEIHAGSANSRLLT